LVGEYEEIDPGTKDESGFITNHRTAPIKERIPINEMA